MRFASDAQRRAMFARMNEYAALRITPEGKFVAELESLEPGSVAMVGGLRPMQRSQRLAREAALRAMRETAGERSKPFRMLRKASEITEPKIGTQLLPTVIEELYSAETEASASC
jgi:hypothetical protein